MEARTRFRRLRRKSSSQRSPDRRLSAVARRRIARGQPRRPAEDADLAFGLGIGAARSDPDHAGVHAACRRAGHVQKLCDPRADHGDSLRARVGISSWQSRRASLDDAGGYGWIVSPIRRAGSRIRVRGFDCAVGARARWILPRLGARPSSERRGGGYGVVAARGRAIS